MVLPNDPYITVVFCTDVGVDGRNQSGQQETQDIGSPEETPTGDSFSAA